MGAMVLWYIGFSLWVVWYGWGRRVLVHFQGVENCQYKSVLSKSSSFVSLLSFFFLPNFSTIGCSHSLTWHSMEGIYGPINHSKEAHDNLGMNLDFLEEGVLWISMVPYIESHTIDFPEENNGVVATLAANHLFKLRDPCEKLKVYQRRMLHNVVACILFISTWSRLDINPEIFLVTIRVWSLDTDGWKKFVQLLNYLNGAKDLPKN